MIYDNADSAEYSSIVLLDVSNNGMLRFARGLGYEGTGFVDSSYCFFFLLICFHSTYGLQNVECF